MKTAVITGASSGLGREFVRQFYSVFPEIERVWLIARRTDRLQELAEQLKEKGISTLTLPLDLCDTMSFTAYQEHLVEEQPEIALLVNNAGCGYLGNIGEIDTVSQTRMIDLNLRALTAITNLSVPYMEAGSRILNVSSIASFCPTPRMTVYSATKAYVSAYTIGAAEELKAKGMLPLFDAGYINLARQYLTVGVNGLVEAAEFLGIRIDDNDDYAAFVQEILGLIERYNRKYRSKEVMFNCEMIPAENVGVKHAKWDREDGYAVPRDCYNSYFYVVEDESLNVIDKFRLHGRRYIEHLTGGSALHMNLEEHLSKEQYRHLLRVAAAEGCNYFTFNIPNTVCNKCGHIDKRYLKECPACHSDDVDYLTRVIGYMKRVSNFSAARQQEAARRYYAKAE